MGIEFKSDLYCIEIPQQADKKGFLFALIFSTIYFLLFYTWQLVGYFAISA